ANAAGEKTGSRPANLRTCRGESVAGDAVSTVREGAAATCALSARPASMNTARHFGQRTLSGLTGTFSSGRKYLEEQLWHWMIMLHHSWKPSGPARVRQEPWRTKQLSRHYRRFPAHAVACISGNKIPPRGLHGRTGRNMSNLAREMRRDQYCSQQNPAWKLR